MVPLFHSKPIYPLPFLLSKNVYASSLACLSLTLLEPGRLVPSKEKYLSDFSTVGKLVSREAPQEASCVSQGLATVVATRMCLMDLRLQELDQPVVLEQPECLHQNFQELLPSSAGARQGAPGTTGLGLL